MDAKALSSLGKRAREQLETALEHRDAGAAQRACEALAKEYVLVHKGLHRVLAYAMEYIETAFREEQAAIAARIAAAVAAGDADTARALLRERDRQHEVIHDLYIDMKARFYSYMGDVFGDRRLEAILRHTGERQRQGFERWEDMNTEDFVRASVHLLKSHLSNVRVHEDDEKFTIIQDPCGSGGRLLRRGAYSGGRGLHRIARAQPMTFGQPDFPSYCAHCAVWNNLQCIEWFGHPQWCIDHPETPADPCRIHIYKDPGKIPARYYRRVGKDPAELNRTRREVSNA